MGNHWTEPRRGYTLPVWRCWRDLIVCHHYVMDDFGNLVGFELSLLAYFYKGDHSDG